MRRSHKNSTWLRPVIDDKQFCVFDTRPRTFCSTAASLDCADIAACLCTMWTTTVVLFILLLTYLKLMRMPVEPSLYYESNAYTQISSSGVWYIIWMHGNASSICLLHLFYDFHWNAWNCDSLDYALQQIWSMRLFRLDLNESEILIIIGRF